MFDMASGKKSIKKKSESIDFVSRMINFLKYFSKACEALTDFAYRVRRKTRSCEILRTLGVAPIQV